MTLGNAINKLRTDSKLSQEQFAMIFGVSQQSVQKWENGESTPELNKIIKISKHFGVSLDALILGNDNRVVENMRSAEKIKPQYSSIHDWEFYSSNLMTEYQQSIEEGLDIEPYKEVFASISRLPKNEIKKKFGDILFEIVRKAGVKDGYSFIEPSDLNSIKALRKPYSYEKKEITDLENKLIGAWAGRVCGCMLGHPLEGIRLHELIPFLKETGNYPMHRYVLKSEITDEIRSKYTFHFASQIYPDAIDKMLWDDDTNYTVLYQEIIENYGRDFTPYDVSQAWLSYMPKRSYCTAERVAFCNFVNGYVPPESAQYKNPYREWIGAQIRADYFGYINPDNPEMAAEMAWRDASVSHIKNGIYGEMFVAAMLAVAAVSDNYVDIVRAGLAEVPHTSRLYKDVSAVVDCYESGKPQSECFKMINDKYDDRSQHDWCHTVSNAMIVAAALLYGAGDYGKSICIAVEAGFDTDCNGATVGSIVGMVGGIKAIPECWTSPINDTLQTTIFGVGDVKISERAKMTLKHIK